MAATVDILGVSMTELARLAGMGLSAIRYHVAEGHITRLPNGRWNPADADALLAARRAAAAPDERNVKLLKARVLGGAVKLRRLSLSVREAQAGVHRACTLGGREPGAMYVVQARISAWPDHYADRIALEIGADPATARAILGEFTAIALTELGDVPAEITRTLDRGRVQG